MVWWAAAAVAGGRLPDTVVPLAETIDLTLDPEETETSGTVVIELAVTERTERIELHADPASLEIAWAQLEPEGGRPASLRVAQPGGSLLRLVAADPLPPGRYRLEISFTGTIQSQAFGLYRFDADGSTYVASQLQADEARTAWPCFDEPRFKIPFTLGVMVPPGLVVISNAPLAERETGPDGDRILFRETEPIPSYAVALLVGPYEATPIAGLPSIAWTVQGRTGHAEAIAAEAPRALGELEEWFGAPHPFAKLDFVTVPEFAYGAMENPGAIVVAESATTPPDQRTEEDAEWTAHVVAHELAHLWFGDLVTMEWWDDLWLNESFAEWMAAKVQRLVHPEQGGEVTRVAGLAAMIREDGRSSARPLRTTVDPEAVFETVNFAVFPKGEALLDMVEAWIGADAMREGIRAHLATHAWGNATAEDLFDALSAASGHDVGPVLEAYLDMPGAPRLRFETGREGTVRVAQDVYAIDGDTAPYGGPWIVPVRLRIGLPDGSTTIVTRLVGPGSERLELPDHRWIHPAADGIGYYAWSLDDADLGRLLAAVPELSAPERMSVLTSLQLELSAGERSLPEVWSLLSAFEGEHDPDVVLEIHNLVTRVAITRVMNDAALQGRADAWIRDRLRPLLAALGPATPGEPGRLQSLRITLLGSLAEADDRDARARSMALGEQALARPAEIEAAWAEWGLGGLARYGPPGTGERLAAAAKAETDPRRKARVLVAYGLVEGPAGLEAAFAHAADPTVPASEMWAVLSGVLERKDEQERDLVLDLAMQYDDAIRDKLSPTELADLVRFGQGCSLERAGDAAAFYGDKDRAVPGIDHASRSVKAVVAECRARVANDGPEIRRLLAIH